MGTQFRRLDRNSRNLYYIIHLHIYSTGKVPLSTKRRLEYTLPYSEFGVYSMESAEDVHNRGKGSKLS
jgi:hypothetical protein